MIHGILPAQFTCLTVFLHNLSPSFLLSTIPLGLASSTSYSIYPDASLDSKKVFHINVKNGETTTDCFKWAMLSAMFLVGEHSDRVSSYRKNENSLVFDGLQFPLWLCQILIFECNNPSIAAHVLAYGEENKSFFVLYLSPAMYLRLYCITLLLLDSPNDGGHYVWMKNLARLFVSEFTDNWKNTYIL